jgi:hypothetical protein
MFLRRSIGDDNNRGITCLYNEQKNGMARRVLDGIDPIKHAGLGRGSGAVGGWTAGHGVLLFLAF